MKDKYISVRSSQLLSYFGERDRHCFNYTEAFAALPESSENAVKELLSDMTKRGLLMRLKEAIYYIIPFEQDPDNFMPDWHLIPACIVPDAQYYIGYYSALQIHNMITQPSLKEQIVVPRQFRPSLVTIKNIPFQFIYHNPSHFFGMRKTWINNFSQVQCSDLEKTIIDCLFKPNYAGGIVEIARAIAMAAKQLRFDTLLEYTTQFKSQAVIKRLGFLLDLLGIETTITTELQKAKTASYVLLDTELPRSGKMISKWSILQNLDTATIKSALVT